MNRVWKIVGAILKWTGFAIALMFCSLLVLRAWTVAHIWMLAIDEPAVGGGFSSPFRSEEACKRALQQVDKEVAQLKAKGEGRDAPVTIVRCSHPRFLPNLRL